MSICPMKKKIIERSPLLHLSRLTIVVSVSERNPLGEGHWNVLNTERAWCVRRRYATYRMEKTNTALCSSLKSYRWHIWIIIIFGDTYVKCRTRARWFGNVFWTWPKYARAPGCKPLAPKLKPPSPRIIILLGRAGIPIT